MNGSNNIGNTDFFVDCDMFGERKRTRKQLLQQISELYRQLDDQNEKREELLYALHRTELMIERTEELLCETEAIIR